MSEMINPNHPYWQFRDLVTSDLRVFELYFSHYFYRPNSIIDERVVFSVSREDFLSDEYVYSLINNVPKNYELAIHSNIKIESGEIVHLPMIDLSSASKALINRLSDFLEPEILSGFGWYNSGRSFHVYGSKFLSFNEWTSFMGTLLLVNQKNMNPIVDPRWIGHRLIARYSALRWTKGTEQYLRVPEKVLLV